MGNNILNEKPLGTFVIIAETMENWINPGTAEGKSVLLEHYKWSAELKAQTK